MDFTERLSLVSTSWRLQEMAELGSGAVREVTSMRLSHAACMAVAMNADKKKEMVKVAQQYFSAMMTPNIAARSMESSILMYKGRRGNVQVYWLCSIPILSGCHSREWQSCLA